MSEVRTPKVSVVPAKIKEFALSIEEGTPPPKRKSRLDLGKIDRSGSCRDIKIKGLTTGRREAGTAAGSAY